jgi:hypothetical protein
MRSLFDEYCVLRTVSESKRVLKLASVKKLYQRQL